MTGTILELILQWLLLAGVPGGVLAWIAYREGML